MSGPKAQHNIFGKVSDPRTTMTARRVDCILTNHMMKLDKHYDRTQVIKSILSY